ncbi:MAG TPA: GyrI-like domain-containing protein [Tepidisphaeraceae bacterium]|nr:GyrI-like domain-containing protein [Tepidisphaeraceae bacterium]
MSRMTILAAVAILLSASSFASAVDPTTQPDYTVAPMRVQRLVKATYFYTETQTTLPHIGDVVQKVMPQLMKVISDNHINVVGPIVFDYRGVGPNPDLPFELRIGVIVSANTAPAGDFRVGELPSIKCASVIYTGPLNHVKAGYDALFQSLLGAGYLPTDVTREYYLYWEGADSVNNIIMIEAGI